tara:strand:+ start:3154 stop:3453 length:300 start_codon:yes stop_codon:yes gene_type:complete
MKKVRFEYRVRTEGVALAQNLKNAGAGVSDIAQDKSNMGGTGNEVFYTDAEGISSVVGIRVFDVDELPEGVVLHKKPVAKPAPSKKATKPQPKPKKKKA